LIDLNKARQYSVNYLAREIAEKQQTHLFMQLKQQVFVMK